MKPPTKAVIRTESGSTAAQPRPPGASKEDQLGDHRGQHRRCDGAHPDQDFGGFAFHPARKNGIRSSRQT